LFCEGRPRVPAKNFRRSLQHAIALAWLEQHGVQSVCDERSVWAGNVDRSVSADLAGHRRVEQDERQP